MACEEPIACTVRQAESGSASADDCRLLSISEALFSLWHDQFAHLVDSALRRVRPLRTRTPHRNAQSRS
jgi:hypothetical protein